MNAETDVTTTETFSSNIIVNSNRIHKVLRFSFSDVNDNPPVFVYPNSNEIRHVLFSGKSSRSGQFISEIVVRDDDIGNNSVVKLSLEKNEYFYIGPNNSLWLRNESILPGVYSVEVRARNWKLESVKRFEIQIFDRHAIKFKLFENFRSNLSRFSLLFIVVISLIATGTTIFLLIYYLWIRLHYSKNVEKRFYGSRLIVNDEEKSKESSPQMKNNCLTTIDHHDYAMIVKPKNVNFLQVLFFDGNRDEKMPSASD